MDVCIKEITVLTLKNGLAIEVSNLWITIALHEHVVFGDAKVNLTIPRHNRSGSNQPHSTSEKSPKYTRLEPTRFQIQFFGTLYRFSCIVANLDN
jgi:hypothetical protein